MRPLIHKTETFRLQHPSILKVVDADEFTANGWPPDRSALLFDRVSPAYRSQLLSMNWGAVVAESPERVTFDGPVARRPSDENALCPGDIIELVPGRPSLRLLYRRGDTGNILFATERCNSYCLMCSQPPREVNDHWRVRQNLDLISLIDRDEPSLAITGGEPTLLGDGLADVINECGLQLPATDLQILSNGRAFSDDSIARLLDRVSHPRLQWNIPLYADVSSIHDYVVQSTGAFNETIDGLYALAQRGMNIEIRIVLHRPTVPRLAALAHFIYRNLSFVRHVAFMGMEPIGFARANREALWIDPLDYQAELQQAVHHLNDRGMRASLYNLPLCVLPRSLWRFAAKSISTWKNVYLPQCDGCSVKAECGGFFASLSEEWTSRGIRALGRGDVTHGFTA
jgi:His-Xaa-Ser system radical SAM maturase HxsC